MLLPTCLVGSYPQPEWLIDRPKLSKQVPRLRARDLWLVDVFKRVAEFALSEPPCQRPAE